LQQTESSLVNTSYWPYYILHDEIKNYKVKNVNLGIFRKFIEINAINKLLQNQRIMLKLSYR